MQRALENPVRLVALIGVVALIGGGLFVLKSTRGGDASASTPKLLHTSAKGHARTKTHRPAAKPKPAHVSPVAANGLPRPVAVALARNPVVVVSVVAPKGRVDALAVAEAKAGAAKAQAGFVRINAYRQAEIAPLQTKTGIKDNPAVIILRRPTQVTLAVQGFVDRDTVVQAVADARNAG
jgi:hypothetical protein